VNPDPSNQLAAALPLGLADDAADEAAVVGYDPGMRARHYCAKQWVIGGERFYRDWSAR